MAGRFPNTGRYEIDNHYNMIFGIGTLYNTLENVHSHWDLPEYTHRLHFQVSFIPSCYELTLIDNNKPSRTQLQNTDLNVFIPQKCHRHEELPIKNIYSQL
jgi:hypothetical protein